MDGTSCLGVHVVSLLFPFFFRFPLGKKLLMHNSIMLQDDPVR